ncbi:hypothetical protein J2Z83_000530 [Virgibacillus natechei]|uniref:UbiD family decarboxylase n=1 Tax=Virgibacillus natechei TaxID=1216297 RepID=A0ABS4IC63_9BACI|nr:DUF6036 family nucleotidyltransferase [Virgibacillus natechei]MBP1968438.1 hypothetical protein [Virgibacillus natechei]UZD13560.1 hypothetical protein OLD84_03105 [Virgibacillus natechei]
MIQLNELKNEFEGLEVLSKHEKMLQICALLTAYFQKDNIKPIIVGGLSVEIYTRNNYTTYDIDLITDGHDKFDDLLTNHLGFARKGRSWYHEKLEISIEIPANFLEGNKEKVISIELENGRNIFVIGIEDIIIHRLESALVSQPDNPDWTSDYEWAKRMFQIHKFDTAIMDLNYLLNASKEAGTANIIRQWMK